jgi:uncharacterized membrane protein YgcG
MLFRSFSCHFLIFIAFFLWGNALSAPLTLHDENRVLSAAQGHYLEILAQELQQKAGFALTIVLLDDGHNKREFLPDDNELLLYTAFKQQQHFVKLGKNLESELSRTEIEKLQQKFLFPEYKSARYDKGTLQLAYQLTKAIVEKKGGSLSTLPPESSPEGSLNVAGWVFVAVIFSLLFYALYRRGRHSRISKNSRRFQYGRFGWR